MTPSVKLALGGALAGLMLTLAVVSVVRKAPAITVIDEASGKAPDARVHADLARCRAATMPESDCEALWEAHRRHFFGEDAVAAPAPESPTNSAALQGENSR